MTQEHGDKPKEKDKKIDFEVVVNGQPTKVKADESARLDSIIPEALNETGNSGQPPENWELRDESGRLLDGTKLIRSYDFDKRVRLFLNLKAGVGGAG